MEIIRKSIEKIKDKKLKESYEENLNKFEKRIKSLGLGSSDLIFFLGAGVSVNYEIKMWKDLAENLLEKLDDDELKDFLKTKDLKYKIQIAFGELSNEEKLLKILREETHYKKEKEILEVEEQKGKHIIQSLSRFKDNENVRYITTNIDRLLETYLNKETVFFSNSKLSDKIIKLHGCINDINSLIFTPKQYADMYCNLDQDRIKDIFSKSTVFFIGKSLEDEIIQMLFKSERLNDVYLLKDYKDDENYDLALKCDLGYYSDLRINILPYTDYKVLPDLVDEIYSKVGLYKSIEDVSELRIGHFLEKNHLVTAIKLLSDEASNIGTEKFKKKYAKILREIKREESKIVEKLSTYSIEQFFKLKKINDGNLDEIWGEI